MQLHMRVTLKSRFNLLLFFVILVYNSRNGHKKYIFLEKHILKARVRVSAKIHSWKIIICLILKNQ